MLNFKSAVNNDVDLILDIKLDIIFNSEEIIDSLDIILNSTYRPICLWVYKSNKNAIKLYKEKGFDIAEETDTRFFMNNKNKKENNNLIRAKLFANEVQELSKKYNLEM